MYLEKLEITGFKSFANKTTLEFNPGLTSIVGPNGSGKSNVADAVRWVLGEQSMKSLRGKKSQDVIFAGTDKKTRLGMAETSLYLNNEDRAAPIDYTQLVITRRVYRDGHGEYFINKNPARLQDILLLLAQANFGQKTYSVIGQGMVDSVLSSSPAERKTLFEDAAGVRQYQMKKEEAVLKLQHTKDNLVQARALMQEIEPRLRSLTRQVRRLERREEIENKLYDTQKQFYSRHWSDIDEHFQALEGEVDEFNNQKQNTENELKVIQVELEKIEKEKTTNEAFQQLQREYNLILEEKNKFIEEQAELKSRLEIGARQEGAADLVWLNKQQDETTRKIKDLKDEQAVIEQVIVRLTDQLKAKEVQQNKIIEEFEGFEQKIIDIRQQLKDQQIIKTEDIRYEIDKLEAIQTSLVRLLETDQTEQTIGKLKREVDNLKGRLSDFRQRIETSQTVADPKDYLELQSQLAELFKTKDNLVNEVATIRVQVEVKTDVEKRLAEQINNLEAEKLKITNQIKQADNAPKSKEEAYQQFLKANEDLRKRLGDIDGRLSTVRKKISEFSDVEQQKKEVLFAQQKKFRDTQRRLNDIVNKLNERRVELARTETRKEDLEKEMRENLPAEQLEKIFAMAQKKSWDRNLHPDDLSTEVQRLKHQLELIGGIEEGTADEYHQTDERYKFLSKQSTDLDESIKNLEQAIIDLEETIKKRFDVAFERINKEFQRFFKTLFGGGQARLSLIKEVPLLEPKINDDDAEEDKEDEVELKKSTKQEKVITGIDIYASPPGKRLKGISMLSGGERALTSIALICAIIYNNPSPFVVLDEVDAALDEANSRRFVAILEKLVNRTQFITITHNRATMERSNILYGVTMGADGVSKLLSMKLEDAENVIKSSGNR
ncbi:chromosome segregation SMC family protein [Patescibacteria group bacterium]